MIENEWKECPVCNKKFKNLGAHMKAHKQEEAQEESVSEIIETTGEDLFNISGEAEEPTKSTEPTEELTEQPDLTPEDRIKNTFNLKEEKVPEISLKDFLIKEEMTYEQLTGLIEKGKDGTALNINEELERNAVSGEAQADQLVGQNIIETRDINTAEALVKKHGYTAESTRKNGKMWILTKN